MEKEYKEINKTSSIIIIVFLSLVILSMIGVIFLKEKSKESANNQIETKKADIDLNISLKKIKENKDWVYDAEYKKDTIVDYYSINYEIQKPNQINVPFINADSEYAKESNKEIKKIFNDAVKRYNDGYNKKNTYVNQCEYSKYNNKMMESVLLTYSYSDIEEKEVKEKINYYTYNFNLKNGNEMTFEDIYTAMGFKKDNIDKLVEEAITRDLKNKIGNLKNYPTDTNFDTYKKETIKNYELAKKNNTLKYFVSNDYSITIILKESIPGDLNNKETFIYIKEK